MTRYQKFADPEAVKLWMDCGPDKPPREFRADTRKNTDGYREVLADGEGGSFWSWEELLGFGFPLDDEPPKLTLIELRVCSDQGTGSYLVDSDVATRRQRAMALHAVAEFLDIRIISTEYKETPGTRAAQEVF